MEITNILQANAGGVTLGLDYIPQQIKNGYAVAITDNEIIFADITEKQIKKEIQKLKATAKKLNLTDYFFGWWLDKKTKKGYLDLVLIIKNKNTALQLAQTFNQKAIFNFKTLESVYLTN